jgi:hypothetical protein
MADDHGVTPDTLLRDFHDARRREDQWRIAQLLLVLITPIFALIAAVLDMMGGNSMVPIALTIITGTGAALINVETWRWHRIALSRVNQFRTSYPGESARLMKDPI